MADAVDVLVSIDDLITVSLALTLAGLSLVSFAFLQGRVRQIEEDRVGISSKRAGAAAYIAELDAEVRRLGNVARFLVLATLAFVTSAALMLLVFDSWVDPVFFADGSKAERITLELFDVVMTGAPFLFGMFAVAYGAYALGHDWLRK